MWDFSGTRQDEPYKDAYRSLLDGVASTGGDEQIVVDETIEAFRLNGDAPHRPHRCHGTPSGSGRLVADPQAHEHSGGAGIVIGSSPHSSNPKDAYIASAVVLRSSTSRWTTSAPRFFGPVDAGVQEGPTDALAACGRRRRDRHDIGFRAGRRHDDPARQVPRRGGRARGAAPAVRIPSHPVPLAEAVLAASMIVPFCALTDQ